MLANSSGLAFQYLTAEQIALNKSIETKINSLAQIVFDANCENSSEKQVISTGLALLTDNIVSELITVNQSDVKRGCNQNIYWAETDTLLFLAYWVDETAMGGLQLATETIYKQLLENALSRGYPHLVRIWNYFSDINRVDHDLERYRQFCVGRFNAFAEKNIGEEQFPSACALGHHGGDLLVYAVTSKIPAQHFENPKQEKAYHYPAVYGPRSPSFARASLLSIPDAEPTLFVSGTASVIGFTTQHPNNLELQIKVTLENLSELLTHVSAQYASQNHCDWPNAIPEVIKVYVRHAQDLPTIQQKISQAFPQAPTVYVAADVCRADLLLEIDGIWKLQC